MLSPYSIHCPFLAIFVLISDIMSGSVDAENSLKEVQEMDAKENKARSRELRLILLAELFRFLSDEDQEEVIEKIKSLLSDE